MLTVKASEAADSKDAKKGFRSKDKQNSGWNPDTMKAYTIRSGCSSGSNPSNRPWSRFCDKSL